MTHYVNDSTEIRTETTYWLVDVSKVHEIVFHQIPDVFEDGSRGRDGWLWSLDGDEQHPHALRPLLIYDVRDEAYRQAIDNCAYQIALYTNHLNFLQSQLANSKPTE